MEAIVKYILLEVFAPLALVACFWWPGGQLLLVGEPHLYYKVFSSGDLIAMCIAIALSSVGHLEQAQQNAQGSIAWHGSAKTALMVSAVIMTVVYIFIKLASMRYTFPDAMGQIPDNIQWMASCNVWITFGVALAGVAIRWFAK